MKKVGAIIQVLLSLIIISACSPKVNQEYKQPTLVHHKAPDGKVDTAWVEKAGCPLNEYSSGRYSGTCSSDSPLFKMDCESITVSDLFGGLPFPVVTCENSNLMPLGNDYSQIGCYLSYRTVSLLTFKDGTYQFIGKKEIKAMSLPIDSPSKALSYVLASTDYYAIYDGKIYDYYQYFDNKVEDTFIEETQNGYVVHLFSDLEPQCSCGDHYTDKVSILVDKDGNITVVESHHFYKFDGCVD